MTTRPAPRRPASPRVPCARRAAGEGWPQPASSVGALRRCGVLCAERADAAVAAEGPRPASGRRVTAPLGAPTDGVRAPTGEAGEKRTRPPADPAEVPADGTAMTRPVAFGGGSGSSRDPGVLAFLRHLAQLGSPGSAAPAVPAGPAVPTAPAVPARPAEPVAPGRPDRSVPWAGRRGHVLAGGRAEGARRVRWARSPSGGKGGPVGQSAAPRRGAGTAGVRRPRKLREPSALGNASGRGDPSLPAQRRSVSSRFLRVGPGARGPSRAGPGAPGAVRPARTGTERGVRSPGVPMGRRAGQRLPGEPRCASAHS